MKILILIMLIFGSLETGHWVADYQFRDRARNLEIIQKDKIFKEASKEDLARLFKNEVPVFIESQIEDGNNQK